MLLGLALTFSVFTRGERLMGPFGWTVSSFLITAFGSLAYVLVLAAAFVPLLVLVTGLPRLDWARCIGSLSAFLGLSVLLELVGRVRPDEPSRAAGAVGQYLADTLASGVGPLGTALTGAGAILLGILAVSRWSLRGALRDGGEAWMRAFAWCRLQARALTRLAGKVRLPRRLPIRFPAAAPSSPADVGSSSGPVPAFEISRGVQIDPDATEVIPTASAGAVVTQTASAGAEVTQTASGGAVVTQTASAGAEVTQTASAGAEVTRTASAGAVVTRTASAGAVVTRPASGGAEVTRPASAGAVVARPAADAASGGSRSLGVVVSSAPSPETEEVDRTGSAAHQLSAAEARTSPSEPGMPEPAIQTLPSSPATYARPDSERVVGALPVRRPKPSDPVSKTANPTAGPPASEPVILERKPAAPAAFVDASRSTAKVVSTGTDRLTYELPPLHLLDYEGDDPTPVDPASLRTRATRLEQKLRTYGVEGRVAAIRPGPVVTTYEYEPAPGVKVSKIANLSDDIAMSMQAVRVRIVAPIPGRGVVGIELPNVRRENVYLKELVAHDRFGKSKSLLTLALGKDAEGDVQVRDLKKMPHLLIAGTTGSGKSVSVNTMILSILYKATPEQVKFIMVDPKMLELSLYNDIPHLLLPVVTDPKKASRALQWAVDEMERRYQLLSDLKVRDIDGFNRRLQRLRDAREDGGSKRDRLVDKKGKVVHDPWPDEGLPEDLPYIVVLIDEFADLMMVAPRDVEASVQRLAQKARAAGIHVLLATQRPSTDVITGVIKNNFPSRLSFRVASRHDSATVINAPGAENLLGMGDSLLSSVATPNPERIHGSFVSEEEVERVVDFWKAQAPPKYDASILAKRDKDQVEGEDDADDEDEHYDAAVKIVCESRKASISGLQRRLRVGYNRAARMIEMMEERGIVGPATGAKGEREVLRPAPSET